MAKTYLSGAIQACGPTLGWWYFVSEAGRVDFKLGGIYGPFFTRDAARADRSARLKTIKHARYRVPFIEPIRAKAFVRQENGRPVWRREPTWV